MIGAGERRLQRQKAGNHTIPPLSKLRSGWPSCELRIFHSVHGRCGIKRNHITTTNHVASIAVQGRLGIGIGQQGQDSTTRGLQSPGR